MVKPENQKRYAKEYHLSFGKRPKEELYKISKDPFQTNNLANRKLYIKVKECLKNELINYLTDTDDPRMKSSDPWKEYPYLK